jgi:hypothetical protein
VIEPDRGEGRIERQGTVDRHDRHPRLLCRVELPVVGIEQRDREDDQRVDPLGTHDIDAPALTLRVFGVGQEQTIAGLAARFLGPDRDRRIEGVGHLAHDEAYGGCPFGDQAAGGMIWLVIQRRDGG